MYKSRRPSRCFESVIGRGIDILRLYFPNRTWQKSATVNCRRQLGLRSKGRRSRPLRFVSETIESNLCRALREEEGIDPFRIDICRLFARRVIVSY